MSITLEERVAILEAEITLIKNKVESPTAPVKPWWEKITGTFANSPDYDKAMQLGKKYRESLRKASTKSRKK
ncbi:hypothetical protein VB774_21195 [Pseudanabaena galeata UHCC 0370]|uniref:Uncharacterized protein n=1 Tax=Pseudanabaena galeata UHCC 0370 TaxID=3110310 RepID=A0ABU5TPQ3_9CYAN|nr:hypothetical protein [Pseudanabaena galeata]MEA5480154.1 hypothetical protein [Pseudanabaena galeata UHCC 0370]